MRQHERATVLVPSILLQRQWEQRLERFVPEARIAKVGGVQRGDPATADVVIAVVHSAMKTDLVASGRDMTLLVADEVHRYGGEGWSVALRDGYSYRLGLTATLERGSDEGVAEILMPYFDTIVHKYGYDRATRERVVAPFDLIFLGVHLNTDESATYEQLSRKISQARKILIGAGANPQKLNQQLAQLRSLGGDVTRAVMVYENATRERRRLLADTPAKHDALRTLNEVIGESRGTVLFTQSKDTADAAVFVMRNSPIPLNAAAVYSEGMSPEERQRRIDALDDGTLDALAAPRILDEGVDIPEIDLGIVMGASSSRRQMIQRLGRVIRLKADNRRARFVVLYVVDSVEDPETGGRDDFMEEVEDAATTVMLFPDWDDTTVDAIWNGRALAWQRDSSTASTPSIGDPREAAATPLPAAPLSAPPSPHQLVPPSALAATAPGADTAPAPIDTQVAASEPSRPLLRPPVSRLSKPLPPPRRPESLDPVVTSDLLTEIEETASLVEWLRAELASTKAG
jgi:RNA polymerase primary sigma factor